MAVKSFIQARAGRSSGPTSAEFSHLSTMGCSNRSRSGSEDGAMVVCSA
jgi:hypothetical protein